MPIFPILDCEKKVQEGDKTRLDASQSFVSGLNTAVANTSIRPGAGADFITLGDDKYLDWIFTRTIPVAPGVTPDPEEIEITLRQCRSIDITADNNIIDFSLDGVGLKYAEIVINEYPNFESFLVAVVTALNENDAGAVFAAELVENKVVISALELPGESFSLLAASGEHLETSAFPFLGFTTNQTSVENEITADEEIPEICVETTKTIQVVSAETDNLFSDDDKLRLHEFDVLKYVAEGRASFKDIHRRAQDLILKWLDKQGYIDDIGSKITLDRIKDIEEVTEWATFLALRLIFEGLISDTSDVFAIKRKEYGKLEIEARDRAVLRIDINQDGVISPGESIDIRSCVVVRR